MINAAKWKHHQRTGLIFRLVSLTCMSVLVYGCTGSRLMQHGVDEPLSEPYRYLDVSIVFREKADIRHFSERLFEEANRYDLTLMLAGETDSDRYAADKNTALLKVNEIDRAIETVEYRRTYGRTSLTQMRGRKSRAVMVIAVRAELADMNTGEKVFLAEYRLKDPWYEDTPTKLATLAKRLVRQLEQDGLIVDKGDSNDINYSSRE